MGDRIRKFLVYRFDSECETYFNFKQSGYFPIQYYYPKLFIRLGVQGNANAIKASHEFADVGKHCSRCIPEEIHMNAMLLHTKLSWVFWSCQFLASAHRCKADPHQTDTEYESFDHHDIRG